MSSDLSEGWLPSYAPCTFKDFDAFDSYYESTRTVSPVTYIPSAENLATLDPVSSQANHSSVDNVVAGTARLSLDISDGRPYCEAMNILWKKRYIPEYISPNHDPEIKHPYVPKPCGYTGCMYEKCYLEEQDDSDVEIILNDRLYHNNLPPDSEERHVYEQ